MTLHFLLKYRTKYGQRLFVTGNNSCLGDNDAAQGVAMHYLNDEYWYLLVHFPRGFDDEVRYAYILKDDDGTVVYDGDEHRYLQPSASHSSFLVIDTWNPASFVGNVFFSTAFANVLLPPVTKIKHNPVAACTHEFRVKAPLLQPGETICLCGSTKSLSSWDTSRPILMWPTGNWFIAQVEIGENEWPATYKYGIWNVTEKKFVGFEEGDNRELLRHEYETDMMILHDGFVRYQRALWRGAGVSMPVFSLRSKKGFGVGEFNDIKLLIDWAQQTGIRLVQLLPVNDTTASHTWRDSYPYAAISAFALHPIYINLDKVAGAAHAAILKPFRKKQKELNALEVVEYEEVMKVKLDALRKLYKACKESFKDDLKFFSFFEMNRDWLVPYAVFSYLRDKYKSPDFSQWPTHSTYDESEVQKLASPGEKSYDAIVFFYFIQYHLHLQMTEVTAYAHRHDIILKGDIPIGVFRYGCDAWVNPSLYHLNEQSGAPPDDFAVKGQNWGFPTYNWAKMREDHYEWWRRRFDQMSNYFDAFRIDHILGFFRIWSIPIEQVEGIMGRFSPAIPVDLSEFEQKDIWFDHDRYCLPYITDDMIYHIFHERSEEVKNKFLEVRPDSRFQLKEFVNTQSKVLRWMQENGHKDAELQSGLFNLISNVILFPVEGSSGHQFHFRFGMQSTRSFAQLDEHTRNQLQQLYVDYFYYRQDEFWKKNAMEKLPGLKRSTNMLVCGEDLGMVPHCVPEVMKALSILSLEIERMPKDPGVGFFDPATAPYLSVVTPSTHDMSTVRGWWEEDRNVTQRFYNIMLGHYGEAPVFCEAWINKEIVLRHLFSPAMWSIFQMQDLLGMDASLRRVNPAEERVNIPSDPNHYWRYRLHINLETLIKETKFNEEVARCIYESGRSMKREKASSKKLNADENKI